jgi:hypothetical protein
MELKLGGRRAQRAFENVLGDKNHALIEIYFAAIGSEYFEGR